MMTLALTVLLAILGAVFVLMARMEKTATSARAESEELKLAADSVVGTIMQRLADDLPQYNEAGRYYDYPGRWYADGSADLTDSNDSWLANLEPEDNGGYRWRHISDLYDSYTNSYLVGRAYNVPIRVIDDYQRSIDANVAAGENEKTLADADGDGVSDARWVAVPNLTTSKGKPVYAAIRIIDNGGMLNVNTAYQFDPNNTGTNGEYIDGSSQTQINLMAMAGRPNYTVAEANALLAARGNQSSVSVDPNYISSIIWRYDGFTGGYTPFDISDELEIRNRFLLNNEGIDTRLEAWGGEFRSNVLSTPVASNGIELNKWFKRLNDSGNLDPNYAYRHLVTTYNMDRVIDPYGRPMALMNDPNVSQLYESMLDSYGPNWINIPAAVREEYAQIAVNIKDYRDSDANITTLVDYDGKAHYGFERPLIYITELTRRFVTDPNGTVHKSYAIEVYGQVSGGQEPTLLIDGITISNAGSFTGTDGQYYVFKNEDVNYAPLGSIDPNALRAAASPFVLNDNAVVKLIYDMNSVPLVLDSVKVPVGFDANSDGFLSHQRNMLSNKLLWRLWDPNNVGPSLSGYNTGVQDVNSFQPVQTFLGNGGFRNVGDIGLMFKKPAYYLDTDPNGPNGAIGYTDDLRKEQNVRIDLADPNVQKIFNYITVFDPAQWGNTGADALKVKGRININTAPWFVLKQLPWVGLRNEPSPYDANALAKAIVAYRDKKPVEGYTSIDYADRGAVAGTGLGVAYGLSEIPGFSSIGELTTVINNATLTNSTGVSTDHDYSMRYYGLGGNGDQAGYPDLIPSDGVADDFEEQNLIFARISDLVTVRSDVFTVYMLIRLGENGPQRRVMAILDRSESPTVKVVAMQEVPDAR
jgi:hypothetical protein